MRAAIYQYWSGVRPPYSHVSERLFRDYAVRIGAQYHFGDGRVPIRCFHKRFFGALAPIWFDDFATYDAVLFADMDVIPVAGLSEDIFASLTGDLMMCEEPGQADLRADMRGAVTARNDLSWARAVRSFWGVGPLLDAQGRPGVFNSGVVLYSREGMQRLRQVLPSVLRYQLSVALFGAPNFYCKDQNYLNAFLGRPGVNFATLEGKWNSQVTRYIARDSTPKLVDTRSPQSCFIHMQHGPARKTMTEDEVEAVSLGSYPFAP